MAVRRQRASALCQSRNREFQKRQGTVLLACAWRNETCKIKRFFRRDCALIGKKMNSINAPNGNGKSGALFILYGAGMR